MNKEANSNETPHPPTLHPDNSKPETNITKEVVSWLSLPDSQKTQALDNLLESLPKAKVISELAKLKFYQPDEIVPFLATCQSLQYDKREVKTIATYYNRLTNGGVERVLALLCHIWIKMGYRVIVVTELPPTTEDYILPEEVLHIVLPDQSQFKENSYFPRACSWQQIIIENHIDAVVYHNWCIPHLPWDAMIIKASGASFIAHTHGIFSLFLTDNHANYLRFVKSYSIADAIITLSDANQVFWQHFNSNVFCTLNPFSEDISNWKSQHSPESHNLLWVGRISGEKHPFDLLDIMEIVVEKVPTAKLHIVGKASTKEEENAFSSVISNKSLQDHIILHGYQTDVRPFFEKASVFLFTSKFEGYPLALQESKMAGLPCVMYELPYLTLTQGDRGIISVRQRDTVSAANAVIGSMLNTIAMAISRDNAFFMLNYSFLILVCCGE